MRYFQGSISDFTRFFSEDCAQQSFLGSKLGFSLGSYLSDKYVSGTNFGTFLDYTVRVEVLQSVFTDIRNFAGDFFRTELCVAGFMRIFFYMNGSVNIIADKSSLRSTASS